MLVPNAIFFFFKAVAGNRACYHSLATFGSQMLLLGTKSFQASVLKPIVSAILYHKACCEALKKGSSYKRL